MVLTLILACKKGGSLNYHLGRRGPERRGDREERGALLTPLLPGWSPSRASWSSSTSRGSGWRSPAHLALEIGHLWWRWLSVVPPFGVLPWTKGLGDRWECPSKCPFNWVRAGRHLPARRSPGGGRSRGPVVMGGEELARGRHSGGVPLLKTRGVAGIVSFVRKWKFHSSLSFSALWTVVTPVSFCCSQDWDCWSCLRQRNTYQLESLFVCFYSTFTCCKKQFQHHHEPVSSNRPLPDLAQQGICLCFDGWISMHQN